MAVPFGCKFRASCEYTASGRARLSYSGTGQPRRRRPDRVVDIDRALERIDDGNHQAEMIRNEVPPTRELPEQLPVAPPLALPGAIPPPGRADRSVSVAPGFGLGGTRGSVDRCCVSPVSSVPAVPAAGLIDLRPGPRGGRPIRQLEHRFGLRRRPGRQPRRWRDWLAEVGRALAENQLETDGTGLFWREDEKACGRADSPSLRLEFPSLPRVYLNLLPLLYRRIAAFSDGARRSPAEGDWTACRHLSGNHASVRTSLHTGVMSTHRPARPGACPSSSWAQHVPGATCGQDGTMSGLVEW